MCLNLKTNLKNALERRKKKQNGTIGFKDSSFLLYHKAGNVESYH